MGTSAGPSLQGIGRGGDSNLVLEMDAHDAKSYPGEPTENLLSSSAMDFSVLSAYTGSTFTRVADGESPTGYACEMYYTGTVNTSARCLFGTNNGNMPTSGSAFVSVWVKRTAGPSTLMRPAYFAGNSWHVMPPLDGGSAYMTSEYRPFGYYGTVGTGSGGPNPGFSMTNGGNSTSSDRTRWIMPQFTTKTYATPFVREGNGGTGTYNARPASVNLMIHGNVGPDTVAGSNNPNVLSEALSKFETSSGWTVGQDWSINSGTEVAEITSWTQASFLQRAASPAEVIEGGRYVIKGDVTTSNAGTLYARVGNSSYAVLPTGTGSTVEVVCGSTATETVLFYSGGWEGTIDNVSVAPLAVMKDSSPSKHAITTVGDTTHSAAQSKFSGGSIYFDGTGDYLRTAAADFLDGSWTVDCWFYYDGSFPGTIEGLIALDYDGASGSSNNAMNFGVTNGAMALLISSNVSSGWNLVNATGGTVSASAWHHAAAVFDGSTYKSYLDGVQVTSNASATAVASQSSSQIIVGTTADASSGQSWNGYIDEVRVTTGTALWTAAFTPPTRRNLSAPIVDRSGNDNGGNITSVLTDVSNYRVGEVIRPIDSAVWNYDGTDDKISIVTDSVDVYCFTIAVKQYKEYTPDLTPGNPNVGFVMGGNTFNGIIMGSWTGTMTDETLSWWGYSSTPSTGSSATYIRDTITAGWHIFTFNWNGSDYDIWVDGDKKTTYARGGGSGHSGLFVGVTAITPGWSGSGWDGYFQGEMGFLRAYDKSLSDQQIIENFHAKRNSLNIPNWSNRDIVQSGLIRWLDFGEAACYPGGAIGTVNDLKTGTAYTVSNSGGGITPSGEGGGCFAFAGTTDDKIPFTATASLYACTVSVWVYNLSGGDTRQTLFGHYFELLADRLQMYSYGFTSLGWRFSTSGSVPYNTWTNAVMTWDGTNVKAYINGALNYTNTVGPGGYAGGFYEISVNWARLKAKLATALIYDRALSASELEQNFIVQKQRFGV